jgi:hypothetical protein
MREDRPLSPSSESYDAPPAAPATVQRDGFVRLFRRPSFDLLLSLVVLILLQPFAETVRGGVPLIAALHVVVLVMAVRLVTSAPERTGIWLLATPTLVLLLASYYFDRPGIVLGNFAMLVVFYAFVISRLFAYVFRDEFATVDDLFAATCIYVLMAMLFACVYAALEVLAPGSFAIPAAYGSNRATSYWDLLYFSFTVLTSTGFGDIHPLARQARAVAVVQQVTGVMYVAILIARLTGMTPIRRSRGR